MVLSSSREIVSLVDTKKIAEPFVYYNGDWAYTVFPTRLQNRMAGQYL